MRAFCARVVQHALFEKTIIGLIVLNGIILGMETSSHWLAEYGTLMDYASQFILLVFIVEAAMKIIAVAPQFSRYFGSGWNLFDFSVVLLSLMPGTGEFAMIARLARLLRVMRLISAIPELRLIVTTLVKSLPGMMHVVLLMSVIFYIYAVAGFHLYNEHDPELWGTLGLSLLTLFRVVTLEDWTDVMYTAMEMNPYSWIFFVSFVVVGTFVVINLFIAVVLNNLDEAKQAQLDDLRQPVNKDQLLKELRQTQEMLQRLQAKVENTTL